MRTTEELVLLAQSVKRATASTDVVDLCDALLVRLQPRKPSPKRDRVAYNEYMRDFMRKRRAEEKAKRQKLASENFTPKVDIWNGMTREEWRKLQAQKPTTGEG